MRTADGQIQRLKGERMFPFQACEPPRRGCSHVERNAVVNHQVSRMFCDFALHMLHNGEMTAQPSKS